MDSLARNRNAGYVQGLGVKIAVHRIGKQLAKTVHVYVCGREDGFAQILACSREVVMIGEHVCPGLSVYRECAVAEKQPAGTREERERAQNLRDPWTILVI